MPGAARLSTPVSKPLRQPSPQVGTRASSVNWKGPGISPDTRSRIGAPSGRQTPGAGTITGAPGGAQASEPGMKAPMGMGEQAVVSNSATCGAIEPDSGCTVTRALVKPGGRRNRYQRALSPVPQSGQGSGPGPKPSLLPLRINGPPTGSSPRPCGLQGPPPTCAEAKPAASSSSAARDNERRKARNTIMACGVGPFRAKPKVRRGGRKTRPGPSGESPAPAAARAAAEGARANVRKMRRPRARNAYD
jgi:hypothetical protein